MGWAHTVERVHVFALSQEYMRAPKAHFYVKPGNPGGFDPANIEGTKMGKSICTLRETRQTQGL